MVIQPHPNQDLHLMKIIKSRDPGNHGIPNTPTGARAPGWMK